MPHPFDRYAPFTDLDALKKISGESLRKSMRANTLKSSPAQLLAWAKHKKWMTEPVAWCPEGFFVDRVDREEALGKDLLHILGHSYMQEAASMLPVALLDPQPGESVLDMSAAPGSKTTQIAARMGNKGVLIANDVQEKRIWSLMSNLQRCGVVNAAVTRKVGQWFARNMTGRFDRVLCDAPCTAQGTARKDSDALRYCSDDNIGKMAKLQRELLESAIHAAKIGGRIVYSTCTLTPEENEGVILAMLERFKGQVEVIESDELGAMSGEKMRQAILDSEMVQKSLHPDSQLKAQSSPLLRLWPQTYNTEGFFSATLRKIAPTMDAKRREREAPDLGRLEFIPGSRQKEIRRRLEERYGTSFVREDELLVQGKEALFVVPSAVVDFFLGAPLYAVGLPFGKLTDDGNVRISHDLVTLRGGEATMQRAMITAEQLGDILKGKEIDIGETGNANGDVLLSVEMPVAGGARTLVVGRGLLKDGKVMNRMPREIVRMFL